MNNLPKIRIIRPVTGAAILILLLFTLPKCTVNKSPFAPNIIMESDEECDVYRALASDSFIYRVKIILVSDSTYNWNILGDSSYLKGHMPLLSEETLQNYQSLNRVRTPIKRFSCPGRTCILISQDKVFHWERNYPNAGGVIGFSRVGFNELKNQALVYWSVYWAPEAAFGMMGFLEKEGDQWILRQSLMVWIS